MTDTGNMFKADREEKDGKVTFRLSGSIDESADFERSFGELPDAFSVNCRDILQINSLGVKSWIDYFLGATRGGKTVSFTECPPPIVEQLNYINNFAAGGKVVSVSVPFTCESCQKELRGVIRTDDLKKVAYKLPSIKCTKCGGKAVFDDVAEEYFSFLMKQDRA